MMTQAEFLVKYMREHPKITEAALRSPPYAQMLTTEEGDNDGPPYLQKIQYFDLPCLNPDWQLHRLEDFPDPIRDQRGHLQLEAQASNRAMSLTFTKDAADLPPFGWVDGLEGHYVNFFSGELVQSPVWTMEAEDHTRYKQHVHTFFAWCDAGFAMWDQERVTAMKRFNQFESCQTGWLLRRFS